MANDLVIVESPAKAKTIERYLGPGYTVLASFGHIRDLPRSDFAVRIDDRGGCSLVYEVPEKSKKHVAALKKAAKGAPTVWLAPDLDREGEAIAWHIAEVLGLDVATTKRVTFDEITESAIREAFAHPRSLDTALVDAQQARRAVDRIVGYRLSPVLWRTVASGISAGRVQSVALRLLVDREEEIRAFVPETYFDFPAVLARDGVADVSARLAAVGELRLATPKDLEGRSEAQMATQLVVRTTEEAEAIAERARGLDYRVTEVRRTEVKRQPKPPFKTSTLQGEGSKLGFSARQTMAVAQQLYEGVALGGEQVGLITYMRTDSLNLSAQSLGEITSFVRDTYGAQYGIAEPRRFATATKGAQEAHEAIRPTSIARTPERIRKHLTNEQFRLYELIWRRTVATQMAPAVFDRVSCDVVGEDAEGSLTFRASGQVERFDGYLRAYRVAADEDEVSDEDVADRLPQLEEGQVLTLDSIEAEEHETSPPPRFSERTLVEVLEELGIGRPSTYASIISTLEQRAYVIKESRRFFPTALGEVVVSFLKAHFAEIVDVNFTARMEETLDEIAAGSEPWERTVTTFLDEVDGWVRERKPERPRLPLRHPTPCHLCGAPMERVFSGKSKSWFASCSRWPDCEGTLPLEADGRVGEPEPEPIPDERVRCPICDQAMLLRSGRYGRFFSCVDYPTCKGIRGLQKRLMYRDEDGTIHPFRSPTDPDSYMELRTSRYGKPFVGTTGYPKDEFAVWSLPLATPCPDCGSPLRQPPRNRKLPIAVCAHPVEQHVYELEDFEVPTVATWTVVDGVAPFDPELGGDAIERDEIPLPIALTFIGTQAPPARRPRKGGDAEGSEADAAATGGRDATKAPATKRTPKESAKKKSVKKAAKKSTKKAVTKAATRAATSSGKERVPPRTTTRTIAASSGRAPAARGARRPTRSSSTGTE